METDSGYRMIAFCMEGCYTGKVGENGRTGSGEDAKYCMHMRRKQWARPELEVCSYYYNDPEEMKGKWKTAFRKELPIMLELGCGKGVSTAQMTSANRDINYIAVDISPDVLGDARRNMAEAYAGEPDNVALCRFDIENIHRFFDKEDGIGRIYIHFCNPWTERPKHAKRRLTHPRQLEQYLAFLKDDGEIWFKTDDDTLFEDSLVYFRLCGFETLYLTRDLHKDGFQPNYVSEHEKKYTDLGVPIKFGIFRKTKDTLDFDPTRWRLTPGMRNE